MRKFTTVMKAISDPNRVKIIKMLAMRELCVCEITSILGLAQPTVSKHLKVLEQAGMVESWKDGSWVNYRLTKGDTLYAAAMIGHCQEWLNDDPAILHVLHLVKTADRIKICAA